MSKSFPSHRLLRVSGMLFLCSGLVGCGSSQFREEARPGEVAMYGATERIRGFDPVKAGDVTTAIAISKIYEGLLQYAYLARPYRLEPCLSDGMPEVSPDGLLYTFRIRKGIFFQDDPCFVKTGGKGRELNAADFVFALKRLADVKMESTGYWAFNDRIVGLDEFREASGAEPVTDYDRPVEGLTAPEAATFRIRLKRPYPQLLWILTMNYAFAVPREAVEFYGAEFINHPVGTGPYSLASWRHNYSIEFVRNPKWAETGRVELFPRQEGSEFIGDAGKPIPAIDRIVQYLVGDTSTLWLMFMKGQVEATGISRDNWDAVITAEKALSSQLAERGIRMYSSPEMTTHYIGFNMDDPVVGRNKKLRQALTCAFNSDDWIRFYNHRIIRAAGPIPPGIAGYDDKPSPYAFNLDKARALLAEAGYPEGRDPATERRLKLTCDIGSANDPEARASVELCADFMNRIGVVLEPVYNNWPTFLGRLERRQVQLYRLGWVADYPDAENFLQLFYGPNSSPSPNHSNYVNSEFDKLYEQARIMQDTPERTALYKKMADIVIEDCPWLYMDHPLAYGLHHRWVMDYAPHDFPYGMNKYYRIDVEDRARWKNEFGGR